MMNNLKISFTAVLFGLSFVMCIVVALLLWKRPKSHLDDAAVTRHSSVSSSSGDNLASSHVTAPGDTPVPELAAARRHGASSQNAGSARRERRVDADVDPANAADDEPGAGTDTFLESGWRVLSSDGTRPAQRQALLINRQGVAPVQGSQVAPAPQANLTPEGLPHDYDPSHIQSETNTPPPIAQARIAGDPAPTPTPRPTPIQIAKPRQTRLPIVTNLGASDPAPPVRGRQFDFPSDAGMATPFAFGTPGTFGTPIPPLVRNSDPTPLAGKPIEQSLQPSPMEDLPVEPSSRPDVVADLPAAPTPLPVSSPAPSLLTPEPKASIPPEDIPTATPEEFVIKRNGAEVKFSNVPPGWKAGTDTSSSALSPGGISSGVISNAGNAGPSPTPSASIDVNADLIGKVTLPPVPAMPGRKSDDDVPSLSGGEESSNIKPEKPRLDEAELAKLRAALPPEMARRIENVASGVAAQVGDEELSEEDANRLALAIVKARGIKDDEDLRLALANEAASEWAERTALAFEAKRQGITVTDEMVKEYATRLKARTKGKLESGMRSAGFSDSDIQKEIRKSALADALVDQLMVKNFPEETLKKMYQEAPDKFQPSRRLHVMEIFRARPKDEKSARQVEQEMQQLQRQLSSGADFSAAASQYSESASKETGGDLGWLDDKSVITEPMAAALVEMKPGQVSNLVQTRAGFQILKLVDVENPKGGFEGARAMMEQALRDTVWASAYENAQQKTLVKVGSRVLKGPKRRPQVTRDGAVASNVRTSGGSQNDDRPTGRKSQANPGSRSEAGGGNLSGFGRSISGASEKPISARDLSRR